ncbi:MAG: AAA domain-containing protein, partial [Candidatus Kapabacteria bacterium]|nr:AAA domain-containing protein [Candidatus Kapabacteria bacterium]
LMGDHCQLPAVVTQKPESLIVRGEAFEQISMSSLGMSAFERLIRCAEQRGDQSSTAMLTMQGRMHKDVMAFVSETFYGGLLKPIADWQRMDEPLPWSKILPHRAVFVPLESPLDQANTEAHVLAQLAVTLHDLSHRSQQDFSIGIITPFRVQNNAISGLLPEHLRAVITVDTVERFQGSERDVILYGTCVGSPIELESIVSETEVRGVLIDRKLNVAMTRARQQFVLLGSPSVLNRSKAYTKALFLLPSLYLQQTT